MAKKYVQGYIYLIGESNYNNRYKIGYTRNEDVNARLKKLQTGNSNPLEIKSCFYSSRVNKLEKMLHMHYKNKRTINEWFELSEEDVQNFQTICNKYQDIINALENNPFF